MTIYNYSEYNISLIDLNCLLPEIETNLINIIYTLQINKNLKCRDLKNIILHSFLIDIINNVMKINLQHNTNKLVIFYTVPLLLNNLETFLQIETSEMQQFIIKIINTITTKFPILIVKVDKHIKTLNSGEVIDLLHLLKNNVPEIKFQKLKQFLQQTGLKKLNKELTMQKMLKLLNK